MMRDLTLVVEDDLHLNIARKIIRLVAPTLNIDRTLGRRGNSYIIKNLASFNEAAALKYYVVILDLDKTECAPILIRDIVTFSQNQQLLVNIAVREAETWVLADRKKIATFLGVSEARIRRNVEEISNPKEYLVNLASHSKFRTIRKALVPESGAKVGQLYNSTLEQFIRDKWDIRNAMKNSKSLFRFVNKLRSIV